jgi:hypothetical protein
MNDLLVLMLTSKGAGVGIAPLPSPLRGGVGIFANQRAGHRYPHYRSLRSRSNRSNSFARCSRSGTMMAAGSTARTSALLRTTGSRFGRDAHFARMLETMEFDVSTHPLQISLFGAQRQMPSANLFTSDLEYITPRGHTIVLPVSRYKIAPDAKEISKMSLHQSQFVPGSSHFSGRLGRRIIHRINR